MGGGDVTIDMGSADTSPLMNEMNQMQIMDEQVLQQYMFVYKWHTYCMAIQGVQIKIHYIWPLRMEIMTDSL